MKFFLQLVSQRCYTLQQRAETSYGLKNMLQPGAATCNGFAKCLQSLQEVESSSIPSVTRYNFLFNLCCNGVVKQIAGTLRRVICPLATCLATFLGLYQLHKVELDLLSALIAWDSFLIYCKFQLPIVTCNMSSATCNVCLFPSLRDKLQEKLHRITRAYYVQSLQAQKKL